MDLDKALIAHIINVGKLDLLVEANIGPGDFEGQENQKVIKYLFDYNRNPRYKGGVPSKEILSRKFPNFVLEKPPNKGIEYCIDQVKERVMYNMISAFMLDIGNSLKRNEIEKAVESLGIAAQRVSARRGQTHITSFTKNAQERIARYEKRKNGEGVFGIPSGFSWVDHWTLGWQPTDMILLLGKRGVGKSWFAMLVAVAAWLAGIKPLFISREMGTETLNDRFDSIVMSVPYKDLRRGQLTTSQEKAYYKKLKELGKRPDFLVPEFEGLCTPMAIASYADENDCGLVIVDAVYMLDSDPGEPKSGWEKHVSIAQGIKTRVCKGLGVPAFLTNQLNKEEDAREADLDQSAYSDAYGQYADVAMKMVQGADERESEEMLLTLLKIREDDKPEYAHRMKWSFKTMEFCSVEGQEGAKNEEIKGSEDVSY